MRVEMTESEEYAARRQSIKDHIRLLEERYSEPERRPAVVFLEDRLARIPDVKAA